MLPDRGNGLDQRCNRRRKDQGHPARRFSLLAPGSAQGNLCFHEPTRPRMVTAAHTDFGCRKQLLVFLCRLSATDFVRSRGRLYDLVNLEGDHVLFIPYARSA